MKKALLVLIALLCISAQGAWAQDEDEYVNVSNESELRNVINNYVNRPPIRLIADIELKSQLQLWNNWEIDLNGHTLSRNLTSMTTNGHVIYSDDDNNSLTFRNGTISGGWDENGGGIYSTGEVNLENVNITNCHGNNGGGIHIANKGELYIDGGSISGCSSVSGGAAIVFHGQYSGNTIRNCTISGNVAGTRGAIWSDGNILYIENSTIKGNESKVQGGAIYVEEGGTVDLRGSNIRDNTSADGGGILVESHGTLKLIGTNTITGNTSSEHGGGGIVNYGTVQIDTQQGDISITGNRCKTDGGGIWNNGTLEMAGIIKISGNTTTSGTPTNVFLKTGKLITLTNLGFEGDTSIGVEIEDHGEGIITSGYSTKHSDMDPNTYFKCDKTGQVLEMSGSEVRLRDVNEEVTYIERSWDETTKTVVSTPRTTNDYDILSGSKDDFEMLKADSWYVVKGNNVKRAGIVVPQGTVHLVLRDGAKLTSVVNFYSDGIIHIYGEEQGSGQLVADGSSREYAAGIGGTQSRFEGITYNFKNGGIVNIHGGTITAKGGDHSAGIGGSGDASGGTLTVYGGKVTATGGKYGAGIGGGRKAGGATVTVYGGTVDADGGKYGAGIGGGQDGGGGTVTIHGGNVSAKGGTDAAGIGTGEEVDNSNIDGGTLIVNGGYVFADGTDWGAGIGGGEDAKGADVTINGGTVIAWAGSDAGNKNGCAIGSEDGDGRRGSLHIGDKMMVHAGQSNGASNYHLFTAGERVPACYFRPYCRIEPCNHEGGIYDINGTGAEDTHTLRCTYCSYRTPEKHDFSKGSICSVCGAKGTTLAVTVYLPDLSVGDGSYKVAETFSFAALRYFKLPEPPKEYEPEGMEFAGWLLKGPEGLTSWATQTGESLESALADCYLGSNLSLTARYKPIDVKLYDAEGNEETLEKYKGRKVNSVTLSGRTLLKDGSWNTICLPFDVTIADSPLKGDGVEVRTLESSTFSDGVLTLNFSEPLTAIEAGKPYVIKWTSASNLVNPVFEDVTINNTKKNVETSYADFTGTYAPVKNADNRLFESNNANKGTCRAFLDIKADTQREDHTFYGWNTEADGMGTRVTTIIPFGANATFSIYALWEENVYDISLKDAEDNSTVFEQHTGKKVNVSYDRVLAATDKGNGEWESRAFTVCLPYALDLTALQEAGQVGVYQPQLIKDNNMLMFTNASPQLEAGNPYVIVVNSGELSLNAHGVRLIDEPKQGCDIYDYSSSTNLLGVFKGTFKKIESADAAAQFAYSLQTDGSFKRIRPDTPNAYCGAFRAVFCADAPVGQDPAASPLGTNLLKAMYQKWLNGNEDENNPIINFPADSFEGDSDISDGTGIMHIIEKDGKHQYYDLQGRKLQNPPVKGIYIDNGRQVIK